MIFSIFSSADYVVHIGAGQGDDLADYVDAGLQTIVLVDAAPAAAESLRRRALGNEAVHVIEAAVNGTGGEAIFHNINFSDLSGLLPPSQTLIDLFPGVQITSSVPMQAVAIPDLLHNVCSNQEGRGLLVLETPGVALGIVHALAKSGQLKQFPVIRIQDAIEPLYLGAPSLCSIREELERSGYVTFDSGAQSDPDRPSFLAFSNVYLDQLSSETDRVKLQLQAAQAETEALRNLLREKEASLFQDVGKISVLVEGFIESATQTRITDRDRHQCLQEQLSSLKLEMSAMRQQLKTSLVEKREKEQQVLETGRVFVVAGVPRSGSTWVYNAIRLLTQKAKLKLYASWVADYTPQEHKDIPIHLVKLHNREDLNFPYTHVITTYRDLSERIASILRMGWLPDEPSEIRAAAEGHAHLHAYWATLSDFEVQYEEVLSAPEIVLAQLAQCLDISLPAAEFVAIARKLKDLPAPVANVSSSGHDKETLMHPGHRASADERNKLLSHVRAVLSDPQ
ncbi:hypothetical protein HGE68_09350 [Rhodobacteraceae bacterium R_SAG6]|nr:hypothetical protein [Rhodobacteraceae bacterium R_SAG6]